MTNILPPPADISIALTAVDNCVDPQGENTTLTNLS